MASLFRSSETNDATATSERKSPRANCAQTYSRKAFRRLATYLRADSLMPMVSISKSPCSPNAREDVSALSAHDSASISVRRHSSFGGPIGFPELDTFGEDLNRARIASDASVAVGSRPAARASATRRHESGPTAPAGLRRVAHARR